MTAVERIAAQSAETSFSRSGLLHFFEYQFVRLRTGWRGIVVTGVFTPVLFLLVMGLGLGELVDRDANELGTSYLNYIGPGLLATTAMQWGSQQALWPTMAEIRWEGGYKAALVTPLTVAELAAGHIGWISARFFMAGVLFSGVLAGFGIAQSWWFLLTPLAATLTCAAFAAPIAAFTSLQGNDHLFPLIMRFVVIPLLLFSGAFFPITNLPAVLEWIARLTPSWHGVELCRDLSSGDLALGSTALHILYPLAFVLVGYIGTKAGIKKTLGT